jgi:hypothetical protein
MQPPASQASSHATSQRTQQITAYMQQTQYMHQVTPHHTAYMGTAAAPPPPAPTSGGGGGGSLGPTGGLQAYREFLRTAHAQMGGNMQQDGNLSDQDTVGPLPPPPQMMIPPPSTSRFEFCTHVYKILFRLHSHGTPFVMPHALPQYSVQHGAPSAGGGAHIRQAASVASTDWYASLPEQAMDGVEPPTASAAKHTVHRMSTKSEVGYVCMNRHGFLWPS